jgi:hypothetical protein
MTRSRAAALAFGAAHVAGGVAGTLAPGALGRPWLGPGADAPVARAALRAFWACDALPAALTVDAVVRGRPLRARLAAGIASDLARIAAALSAREVAPRRGSAAMVAASAAGALTAAALLPHVDRGW